MFRFNVCLDVLNFFKTLKQKRLNLSLYFRLILRSYFFPPFLLLLINYECPDVNAELKY